MSAHTIGPWVVTEAHGEIAVRQSVTLATLATVAAYMPEDEARANARVMAAGPVMLAALHTAYTALVDYTELVHDDHCEECGASAEAGAPLRHAEHCAFGKILAAIAAAEGRA